MNPNNFILSTDFPLDKVLETMTGVFSAGARYGSFSPRRSSDPRLHTIRDCGLVVGTYSIDAGTTWYPFGVRVSDTSTAIPTFQTVEVNAYCDTEKVEVQASNWTTSARTIQYALAILARD